VCFEFENWLEARGLIAAIVVCAVHWRANAQCQGRGGGGSMSGSAGQMASGASAEEAWAAHP